MLDFNITSLLSSIPLGQIPAHNGRSLRMWRRALGIFVILSLSIIGCSSNCVDSKPTVSVWHWMTDRDATFQELAKKFNLDHIDFLIV